MFAIRIVESAMRCRKGRLASEQGLDLNGALNIECFSTRLCQEDDPKLSIVFFASPPTRLVLRPEDGGGRAALLGQLSRSDYVPSGALEQNVNSRKFESP